MLTHEQNQLLTRVGPGTPMGEMLREYWMPAIQSSSLERDGAPKRVRLMGENFVAFRATDDRVGFVDEACPHRSASLALGRNEQGGLRCIFHGWKISPDGKIVDTYTGSAVFSQPMYFLADLAVNGPAASGSTFDIHSVQIYEAKGK